MTTPRTRVVAEPGIAGLTQALIDLVSALGDAKEKWGRTDGKIDVFIEQLKVHDQRAIDLEARMRKVENRQHWYAGAGAVLGAIFGRFLPTVPHA